jgi:hypothetical protein
VIGMINRINKYYLYKKVLTSKACTEELDTKSLISELFGGEEITLLEAYENRVEMIMQLIKTQFIEDLENVNGRDIISLFAQSSSIKRELTEKNYADILIKNGHIFLEVLEGLFKVTLDHIYTYEEAEKQLTGSRMVTVIVDGNNHNLMVDGKRAIVQTEIIDNIVTIEKCQEVFGKIIAVGHTPKKLEFMLSIYTDSKGNECGDFQEECLLNRKVYYFPKSNCMRIWENGYPIFENCNGVICEDRDALADCLL